MGKRKIHKGPAKTSKNRQKPRPEGKSAGVEPNPTRRAPPDSGQSAAKLAPIAAESKGLWLYGQHPVLEAIRNRQRRVKRLLATTEAYTRYDLDKVLAGAPQKCEPERASRREIETLVPPGAVHQGLALLCDPLAQPSWPAFLQSLSEELEARADQAYLLIALDQVTDPHNVGAIMRSAAAFGARGLIGLQNHAPSESAVLVKSASGAFDHLPYLQVRNLTKALKELQEFDFWSIGLAAESGQSLAEIPVSSRQVVVLGSEGHGLRRLTRERCDFLARLPTGGPLPQLNVSNAAAIALYELLGRRA